MKSFACALLLMLVMMSNAFAETSVAQKWPLDSLKTVGQAKLKVWFWDIYRSSLLTENGRYEPEVFPQALHLEYLRSIEATDLLEQTRQEWQRLGLTADQFRRWLDQLSEFWPDVDSGDSLTLVVKSDGQSDFFFNQHALGTISDPAFGRQFLRIWLDERCRYPALRQQLTGLSP